MLMLSSRRCCNIGRPALWFDFYIWIESEAHHQLAIFVFVFVFGNVELANCGDELQGSKCPKPQGGGIFSVVGSESCKHTA